MTYRKLLEILSKLDDETLSQDVTVLQEVTDEYWKISTTDFTVESDVMDDNHFILVV